MSYRDEARRAFDSAATREIHEVLLQALKPTYPDLQGFKSMNELMTLLRAPSADKDAKDRTLLALIKAHHAAPTSCAFTILSTALFPMLDRLYHERVKGSKDPDGMWATIYAAFLDALDAYPVARRPKKVAANLRGETMGNLRKDAAADVARKKLVDGVLPLLEGMPAEEKQYALWQLAPAAKIEPGEIDLVQAAAMLEEFLQAGLLNEDDRALIVGVYAAGRTIGDMAIELHIGREAAKKRLQRAVERIRTGTGTVKPGRRKGPQQDV
jgi:DNA-directed RNA polymerase specialized sigma24 family protein